MTIIMLEGSSLYRDILSRFIKKDCKYLDMSGFTCKLAEMSGTSQFPNRECYDCLVALYRLRAEMLRNTLETDRPMIETRRLSKSLAAE